MERPLSQMKYTAKLPPEGINVSTKSPLKQFFLLLAALAGLMLALVLVIALLADYFVQYIPRDVERNLFSDFHSQFEPAKPGTERHRVERYLDTIINNLSKKWTGEKQQFSVAVIESDVPNAFVLPGGHIGVSKGLLRVVKSENGLAMILGHEMGHQYKRHPIRALGRGLVVALVIAVATGTEESGWASGLALNTATLFQLVFSRDQEREADTLGLLLITRHYGHGNGATEFFKAILKEKSLSENIPTFLKTHPSTKERVERLINASNESKQHALIPLPDYVKHFSKSTKNKPD